MRRMVPQVWMASFLGAFVCVFQAFGDSPRVDYERERLRLQSAADDAVPHIERLEAEGEVIWSEGQRTPANLVPGQRVTIVGSGLGAGPDIDYSKIVVGKTRALERDVVMYRGVVQLLKKLFFEVDDPFSSWKSDILEWTDTRVVFTVPKAASQGPLAVQVQKRIGNNPSLTGSAIPYTLWDPMTERVRDISDRASDVVSTLGAPRLSNAVPVSITNSEFAKIWSEGEAAFWSFDYNVGLVHHLAKMDWASLFYSKGSNPTSSFGALPYHDGEVPEVASHPHYFENFPAPMPIKPLLRPPLFSGWSYPTGYVGFMWTESINPVTQLKSRWIGFSCSSCHAQRITYEASPGKTETRVFPGLPNFRWRMRWNVLGGMQNVVANEPGPDGAVALVDKSNVLDAVPPGTGEASLVRNSGDGSIYANDYLFSPIAIPIITRHTPVRRALSRTELIIGFEGSYAHAEEPDGGLGALRAESLQALTAYMTTLDSDDNLLRNLGMYRWLKKEGLLDEAENVSEGNFVERGYDPFPRIKSRVSRGKASFDRDCLRCHQANFGTWSDENMIPLTQVGGYFSPTIFERQTQSIRTSILRDLYWVEKRGLLHDGHVKSLKDLVSPDRCREGSALYNRYYTIHPGSFHVPKGNEPQERALRRHAYFVDVPWDKSSLYWDYQKMRSSFGPRELGSKTPLPFPAAPHPWCAQTSSDVEDMVAYLLTL